MASNALGVGLADNLTRVDSGIARVREHTIEIGSTVLWIDNIGSIFVVEAKRSYFFLALGALAVLVGFSMLGSNPAIALGPLALGALFIYINLNQKIDAGLSIGTIDGRRTLIVSTDRAFLARALAFLREKIDSESVTLQGSFDIRSNSFNAAGGAIIHGEDSVTIGAVASPAGEAPGAPATPQFSYTGASHGPATPTVDDYVQQARSLYERGASEIAPRVSEFMSAQNWPVGSLPLVGMLALTLGGFSVNATITSALYTRGAEEVGVALVAVAVLASACFAVAFVGRSERLNRPALLGVLLLLSAALTGGAGFLPHDYIVIVVAALLSLNAIAIPLVFGRVSDNFTESNRAGGIGALIGAVALASFILLTLHGWASEKFGAKFTPLFFAGLTAVIAFALLRRVKESERDREIEAPRFGAVWRRIGADRAASFMMLGVFLTGLISPVLLAQLGIHSAYSGGQRSAIAFVFAAVLGAAGGGMAADFLAAQDIRFRAWVSACSVAAGALIAALGIMAPSELGGISAIFASALLSAAIPPAYGVIMAAAGQRGHTSAAALISLLSSFVALNLGWFILIAASALIGKTNHIDFGFKFPGLFSCDIDGARSAFYSAVPVTFFVQFFSGEGLKALNAGLIALAVLMAWPAWCFYRGGKALADPARDGDREMYLRGGPPGFLITTFGAAALLAITAYAVMSSGPDPRLIFARAADAPAVQNSADLIPVNAQTPLTPAALEEATPSLMDRLYRKLPLKSDPAWSHIERAMIEYSCSDASACGFKRATAWQINNGAAQLAPGAAFAGFTAERNESGCTLKRGKAIIAENFCAGQSGSVQIFAPAPLSLISLIAFSSEDGRLHLSAFDGRRGAVLFDDSSMLDGCSPAAQSWSPSETRVLLGAVCANGDVQLVLVDLVRRFYASTRAPARVKLNYDLHNAMGQEQFSGFWNLAPQHVRLRGRRLEASLSGRLNQVAASYQTPTSTQIKPENTQTWFERLHPTQSIAVELTQQGLAQIAIGDAAPTLSWAPSGADEVQTRMDSDVAAAYGSQPTSVAACESETMCWNVTYANGEPPPIASEIDPIAQSQADTPGEKSEIPEQYPVLAEHWIGQSAQDGRRSNAVETVITQRDGEFGGIWLQSIPIVGPMRTRFSGTIGLDGVVTIVRTGIDGELTQYSGVLDPDGATISGRWQRGQVTGSFQLQRR